MTMAKKKESLDSREKLDKKLTAGEKKLLANVLRERSRKVRDNIKKHSNHFKTELKKALFTAVIAAFGFLIALEWREVIQKYVDSIVGSSPVQGQFIGAVVVTLIAVVGIIIATKFLKVDEED
jgi:hypothetical protein